MTRKSLFLQLIFIFSIVHVGLSQTHISGQIIDEQTHQPLPFVNILYDSQKRLGTTTDIDGRFSIEAKTSINQLDLSYMGYKPKSIKISDYKKTTNIIIGMSLDAFVIADVSVYYKGNPAHRIINKTIENRKKNHPESLASYQYESYSKMFFTFDLLFYKNGDTLTDEEIQVGDTLSKLDSSITEVKKFKDNYYLFLLESVTEKKYKRPGRVSEKVIASRVSGLQNPTFALIGTQLQSFTIYEDYILVGGKKYLSPLSVNSPSKYFFQMQDTLVNTNGDTTYTISFRPRKNTNFEGLEGVLQINTKGYALQNFSTKPTEQDGYSVTVRQKYELVQDSAWFPTQLDADFVFKNIISLETKDTAAGNKGPDNTYIYGKSKTYIRRINLNSRDSLKKFSHIAVDYSAEANNKDSLFWSQYRQDAMTTKEQNTYQLIDSIGKASDFDKKLRLLGYVANMKIPMGPISLLLDKLMSYNVAEGYRLGLGLATNEKVSKHFEISGYGAYGFGDKKWKYGGDFRFNIRDQFDSYFQISHSNDVEEPGHFVFLENSVFLNPNNYRDFLINKMVYQQKSSLALELRFFYYLKAKASVSYTQLPNLFNTYELTTSKGVYSQFEIPEATLQLRFAYGEQYMRTPLGIQPIKTPYPVLFLNFTKSLTFDQFQLDYYRFFGKIEKQFVIRNMGKSHVSLQGGYAWGDLPYFKLFSEKGSYYPFTILALNSFATMRLNEFLSDQFVYLFYRHSFGNLLFKAGKFKPEFSILHNMGWGNINQKEIHSGLSFKTMNLGYFESGIAIDRLLNLNFISYGIGIHYRYGPYQFEKPIDNFAFKMSFLFNIL